MRQNLSILVVEDDKELNQQLSELLVSNQYHVAQCYDGEHGLVQAASGQHQLVLLDVMLPKRDGFSVLKMLRKTCQTPVIMVTAKGAEQEKIEGFSQGADDYVAKPFSTGELMCRIEALLRRTTSQTREHKPTQIEVGNLKLNTTDFSVSVGEVEIEFTPTQFGLLWELLLHKGEVLSKAYLYQRVLNRNIGAYDRSLDMHLSRVRKKLNEAGGPGERLRTSHGKGYCFI